VTGSSETGGGIERFNQGLFEALSLNGTEVRLLGLVHQPTLLTKLSFVFSFLKTLCGSERFDLIFCGHLHLAFFAALLASAKAVPFWLQLHGGEAWQKPSEGIRWAVRRAALITAVSRYTRRRFLQWANVRPEKVLVLPNTYEEKFKPGPKPEYLIKRYGLENKTILLTVSRLSSQEKYKGHERILRLMPKLIQRSPDLVYVIAGEGDDRKRLEAVASENHLDGCVRFVGKVDESELPDLYRMADLFVMPSTGEGFGIVFLEAAACAIPVIGGNRDGSLDALREGNMGRLIDPEEPAELGRAILDTLSSKKTGLEEIKKFSNHNFSQFVGSLLENGIRQC